MVVLSGAPWGQGKETGLRRSLSAVALLVPSEASKVVCIGQNYRKHAEEMGKPVPPEPLIFMKPSTSLNAPRSPIRIPKASEEVHYEAELGLRHRRAAEERATRPPPPAPSGGSPASTT